MVVFNLIQFTPVSYGTYKYPSWAVVVGWMIGFASVIPIPLYIIKDLWAAEGTLLQVCILNYSFILFYLMQTT